MSLRKQSTTARTAGLIVLCLYCFISVGRAEDNLFTNLLAQGDALEKQGDVAGALKSYISAETPGTNCVALCLLTRRYCDLMHDPSPAATQKTLAQKALACALRAVQADNKSATAHLSLAVSYVKNFPYNDNETKVKWSRAIKTECETGVALDPKQDVGYYLLGRWNYTTANMNFFLKGLVKVVYGGLPKASDAEAIKNFQQAIALAPNRIIHHSELARVYATEGENKLAISELETCARLKPIDRDDVDAQEDAAKRLVEIR